MFVTLEKKLLSIREAEEGVDYIICSPEDEAKIASRFIGRGDREVFFVCK